MGETQYEVILAPSETPLWDATETREFTLTVDSGTQWDTLDAEIKTHVTQEDILDEWAFRKYWEPAYVVRHNGSHQQRLKDALRSCTVPDQVDGDAERYPLSVQIDTRPTRWSQTALILDESKQQEISRWMKDMKDEHPITLYMENRCIHEAMVRAVATVEPSLVEQFKDTPRNAHHLFVNIVTSYGNVVADELKSVEP